MLFRSGSGLPVQRSDPKISRTTRSFISCKTSLTCKNVERIKELPLALLVTKVVANDHDATITTNNFALVANLLHAWFNLHDFPLSLDSFLLITYL